MTRTFPEPRKCQSAHSTVPRTPLRSATRSESVSP